MENNRMSNAQRLKYRKEGARYSRSAINRMVRELNEQNTKEVKKLMDCSICTARKERNRKLRGIATTALKAAFATSFQLVMSIVVVAYLITEGVIL